VRQFVISTMAPALWLLTIFDLMSIIAMFTNHEQNHKNPVSFLTGILCLGLFYDSLILSLGAILPFGQLLKILSQFRYILHCVLIPLLFPICAYSLKIDKQKMRIIWIVSIVIMIIGFFAGIAVVTEERTVGLIRRYAESKLTPKFADSIIQMLDIVPVFFMMGIGVYLWIKKKNPFMFLSGFFMFAFTMLGIFLGKDPGGDPSQSLMFYISMYGESLMVFFLYCFIRKEDSQKN